MAACVLLSGMLVFHSWAGERYIVRRLLRRDNLPKLFGADTFTKRTIRYAWHLLTVVGAGLAAILAYAAARPTPAPVLHVVAATLALGAIWGLAATRARHLSWILLAATAALTEWAALG